MKRLLLFAALLAALAAPCFAGFGIGSISGLDGFSKRVATGGCTPGTHASTFLARTSGLSGTETTAYCNLINGLDTDGTWSLLDLLYVFATNTTTTANLNVISTSFTLTAHGTCTFTADQGYQCDGSTGSFDTGYAPSSSGTHLTQNSASLGSYILNARSTNATNVTLGVQNAGPFLYQQPFSSSAFFWETNGNSFPSFAATSTKGAWAQTRTASNAESLYLNGSTSAVSTSSGASNGIPAVDIFIGALNNAGTAADFSNDQIAAVWAGGGLTSTQATAINNRINTFMQAFGKNVY